jgi:hypothetical protein
MSKSLSVGEFVHTYYLYILSLTFAGKLLKYNYITLLEFILTISTRFGESMNLHELLRKYAKKPL